MNITKANPLILGNQADNGLNDLDTDYLEMADKIMRLGSFSGNRTEFDTYKYFGTQLETHLMAGFPLLSTKKVYIRPMFEELFWMLNGHTNIQPLLDADVHIWDGWANKNGDLGPIYGQQWRNREDTTIIYNKDPYWFEKTQFCKNNGYTFVAGFKTGSVYTRNIDQIQEVLNTLLLKPNCRRLIVDSWNPAVLPTDDHPTKQAAMGRQSLPACHTLFQFGTVDTTDPIYRVRDLKMFNVYTIEGTTYLNGIKLDITETQFSALNDEEVLDLLDSYRDHIVPRTRLLNTHLYMRSSDIFLGQPFNIASYAALTALFCAVTQMIPNRLILSFGDIHIYENHVEALQKQANNLHSCKEMPYMFTIGVGPTQKNDLKNLTMANVRVVKYEHCAAIKADVAI
jgi:thymidylate synthase